MPPCGHKSVIAGLNTFNDFKECQILSPYLLAPFVVVLTHFNASSSPPLLSPLPQTAGEWAQVLQLQRQFHQAQLSKWQQILQSSVTLLDQVCVYVCASVDDTIAWLASGSRRVMQKLLVVLLIPLCQCHKKRHQSSDTGGADHPPLLVSGLAQTHRSEWEDYYAAHMMSVLKKNHRSETIPRNSSRSLRAVNTDMKN